MCARNDSMDDPERGSAVIVALRVLVVLFALCGLALQVGALVARGCGALALRDRIRADGGLFRGGFGAVVETADIGSST